MSFRIHVQKKPSLLLFVLEGKLDICGTVELREKLEMYWEASKKELILDMKKLAYMDSSGIGALIKTLHDCHERKCSLSLANPNAAVAKTLQVSGLQTYFEIISQSGLDAKLAR